MAQYFPQIILLGDSITQLSFSAQLCGFGAHLSDAYQRRADVLNRGFSGYNTRWMLEHLHTESGRRHVFGGTSTSTKNNSARLITIFFGANDASDPALNPRHFVPVAEYRANLRRITALAQESCPRARIVLICPPPVHHASRLRYQIQRFGKDGATGRLERTLTLSRTYADAAQSVAEELKVPYLNLWQEMTSEKEEWHTLLSDGLHLSKEGNQFVGRRLLEVIGANFPELKVTPCPQTGFWANSSSQCAGMEKFAPWHDDIDHTNPTPSFHEDL